jgi:hypothetical protein
VLEHGHSGDLRLMVLFSKDKQVLPSKSLQLAQGKELV